MNIDIRTLFIVLVMTDFLQTIAIFLQYLLNKTYRGIGWWVLGFTSVAIGFVLLLLRDFIAIDLISIILANALLVLGAIFIYIGSMRFFDKKENRGIVIPIFVVFILSYFYFTYVNNDITIRSFIASVTLAVVSFLTALGLFVKKTRSITASANFVSAVLLANGCFFIFRAVVLLTVSPIDSIFTPTLMQTAVFLVQLIEGILLTFGLIIMVNQRLNAEMREAKEYLENLIKYANAPIIVWDTSLSITRFNQAFENLSGYQASEVIGKKIDILFSKNQIESALEHIQKTSSGERWEAVEIEIQRKDGEPRIVLWNSANILDTEKNNIIATIAQGQDITERKQAELLILIQRDLALAISFSHKLDEALSKCLDTILQLSEMDCGGIYLVDQVSGDLNLICYRNLSPAFIKRVSHYKADSVHTRLVMQGKPVFTRYSELDLPLDEVEKAEKLRAFAALPLIFENRVIGCLNLASQKLEDVSEINREVLKTAATLMGEGITRLKIEEELKETNQKLHQAIKNTIQAMALILEKRDPYTAGHQERVTMLACAIAEEISLPKDKIEGLYMAGIIHDIGKINVPTEILSKPGKLNEIELSLIQTHPQVGSDILKEMELPGEVFSIVLQHHERMDGSGYPSGLSGKDIILEARILEVADVVEAMASHRPYRPALGLDKALEEITKNKGKLYDPEVVDVCLNLFKEKGFKFE